MFDKGMIVTAADNEGVQPSTIPCAVLQPLVVGIGRRRSLDQVPRLGCMYNRTMFGC